jgi:uncharacterized membrane protein (DUF4010 family)
MQALLPNPDLIVKVLLGFVVGALIGLERQKKLDAERVVGVRSFGLHSLLGTLSAYSTQLLGEPVILIYSVAISVILVASQVYYKLFRLTGKGLTTPLVFAISFILGVVVGMDNAQAPLPFGINSVLAMTVSFGVFLVLWFKDELAHAVEVITRDELISAVELGVIILFLWPLVPTTIMIGPIAYPLLTIYFLIVILLAISFANYLLVKKYKDKGVYFFGFFGGLASSEAAVTSVTHFYVNSERKGSGKISLSVVLANVAMVVRNGFLLIILDTSFRLIWLYLIPIVAILVFSLVRIVIEEKSEDRPDGQMFDTKLVSPFEFGAALRFAAIFAVVYFIQLGLTTTFSDIGVVVAAIVGGFVSAGAVVASVATLFFGGQITMSIAAYAVILASTTSVFNKMMFVYLTDRQTGLLKKVARDSAIIGGFFIIYLLALSMGLFP